MKPPPPWSGDRKTIEQGWDDYRRAVIPREAGVVQIQEMRRAFYAGAESLMVQIINGLSPGPESTPGDVDYLSALNVELHNFAEAVKKGMA
jgi:hypothetical protein